MRLSVPAWVPGLVIIILASGCGREAPVRGSQGVNDEDELREVAEPLVGTWTGDLPGMVERRQIRALVPYSRTFYFLDERGSQHGLSHAFMEAFEDYVNTHLDAGLLRVQVVYVPVTRDRLVPWLLEGRGDLIAANLTATRSRERAMDFTEPLARGVDEVLVSGPTAAPIDTLEQLSGRTVLVRTASSFYDSLQALNRELQDGGLAPVRLKEAPAHFEVGDVLELVNAGVVEHAVADDYLAEFWARVLPDIVVHEDLALRSDAEIAFAVRTGSPALRALLDEFLETHRAGTLFGNVIFERYLQDTRWVMEQPIVGQDSVLKQKARLFQEYGAQYDLDWLLLLAQGYQESRLNHDARSPAGAVGVMQILPATGREMGVGDVTKLENNIHAGARYLRWMMDRYYDDEDISSGDQIALALASYNAGPGRVRSLRREAAEMGLDPDAWFDNVEYVAAQRVGRETVEYVHNIFKYHIAFSLIFESGELEVQPD